MKTKHVLLFCAAIFISFQSYARIWRVNNMSGSSADFTVIQDAIDAASSGDTVHVEGGLYDGFTVSKPLYVQGTHFDTEENSDIYTPMPITQLLSSVTIENSASGSTMTGFNLSKASKEFILKASHANITRNSFYTFNFSTWHGYIQGVQSGINSLTDILISNNVFNNAIQIQLPYSNDTLFVNSAIFSNNVIKYYSYLETDMLSSKQSFSAIFDQNVILSNPRTNNCIYTNNIFSGTYDVLRRTYNNNVSYCIFTDNVTSNDSYQTGSNNIFDASSVFASTGYYILSETSVAKGAGTNGQNAGIYGGANPFVPGGYVASPTINMFTVPGQVQSSMTVNVKAKVIE